MPGLVAFGRRWRLASDDFVVPVAAQVVVRAAWFVLLLVYAIYTLPHVDECRRGVGITILLVFLLVADLAHVILELRLIWVSSTGTVLDTKSRQEVPHLLYVLVALGVAETFGAIAAAVVAFARHECTEELEEAPGGRAVFAAVIAMELAFCLFVLITVFVFFDSKGTQYIASDSREVLSSRSLSGSALELPLFRRDSIDEKSTWEMRFRCFVACSKLATCGCIGGNHGTSRGSNRAITEGDRPGFEVVASLIYKLLGSLDFVLSDLVAGVALLRAIQRDQYRRDLIDFLKGEQEQGSHVEKELDYLEHHFSSKRVKGSIRVSHRFQIRPGYRQVDHEADRGTLVDCAYYLKYAMGVYGWVLQTFIHLCWGGCAQNLLLPCVLTGRCCRTRRIGRQPPGDNVCGSNFDSFLLATRRTADDIIYASFVNIENYTVPFVICKDTDKKAIVIACRGSLSTEDLLTDVTAVPESVSAVAAELDLNIPTSSSGRAHGGILRVAINIAKRIEDLQCLQGRFSPGGDCEGYSLVITGHSLGAGVASLLALLLKKKYPRTLCFAFGSPGGLMDRELAESMNDYCISVVIGEDIIPRLSVDSIFNFRNQVVKALAHTRATKVEIFRTAFLPYPDVQKLFVDEGDPEYAAAEETLELFMERMDVRDSTVARGDAYMGGRILHFAVQEVSRERSYCVLSRKQRTYECFWASRDAFSELIMSHRVILDHVPDYAAHVIGEYVTSLGGLSVEEAARVAFP